MFRWMIEELTEQFNAAWEQAFSSPGSGTFSLYVGSVQLLVERQNTVWVVFVVPDGMKYKAARIEDGGETEFRELVWSLWLSLNFARRPRGPRVGGSTWTT